MTGLMFVCKANSCLFSSGYDGFLVFQVVKHFLKLASDRANAAREESEQAVLHEVDDLDVIMTPEKSVPHQLP